MVENDLDVVAGLDEDAWQLVSERVRQLEASWRDGRNPDFAALVPATGHPGRLRVLVELIKVDQEMRWKSGQETGLETYLERWPELAANADTVRDLLAAECLTRNVFGQPPSADEIRSRFPGIGDRIDLPAIRSAADRERRPERRLMVQAEDTSGPTQDATPSHSQGPAPLRAGQRFGRYEIRGLLGQGGMGTVYRAYDTQLTREVALKIPRLDPGIDPEVRERFLREAQTAAKIRHPNICTVYDVGEIDGAYYLTMELIEGESLATKVNRGATQPAEAVELVLKVARALAAVHAAGMIHRDIKASNVMIDTSGEPRLTDFGLARSLLSNLESNDFGTRSAVASDADQDGADDASAAERWRTQTGIVLGTLPYLSREQAEGGPVDARSDVYSLGVLLYQLLTGQLPYGGTYAEVLTGIRQGQPPVPRSIRPEVDEQLEGICLKAMATSPEDRFPSAELFAEALGEYLVRNLSRMERGRRWRTILTAVGVLSLVFAGVIITIEITRDRFGISVVPKTEDPSEPRPAPLVLPIERWIQTDPRVSDVALSPDGATLYVAYSEYTRTPGGSRIQAFDFLSGKLLSTIEFPHQNYDHKGMAISGDGRYLFVTNYYQRQDVSRIDLHNGNARTDYPITDLPPLKAWPWYVGITPDRRKLAVALGADGRFEDLNNDRISIVDVADGKFSLLGEVHLQEEPCQDLAFSADSRFVYVAAQRRTSSVPLLYEVRLTPPFEVTRSLPLPGSKLGGISVSSRLQRVFVSDSAQRKILGIDMQTFKPISGWSLNGYAPGPLRLDGREEVLAVVDRESRKLFLLDANDGTSLGRVDKLRDDAQGVEFSHDGRSVFVWHSFPAGGVAVVSLGNLRGGIAFASNRAGEGYQIYRMSPDGKTVDQLTNNHATDRCPRWSPDGRKIAYVSTAPGPPRICLIRRDGGKPTILQDTDPVIPNLDACATLDWSPDGSGIAFIGAEGRCVRIVDVRTGAVRTLVSGDIGDGCVAHLSLCYRRHDGQILLNSQTSASAHVQGIFLLDPETGKTRRLAVDAGPSRFFKRPVSSPDGKSLAMLRTPGLDLPPGDIFVANADGSEPSCVVEGGDKMRAAVRWSADGESLVYSASFDGRNHVYVVGVREKKSVQLTRGDGDDVEPDLWGTIATPPTR